MSWAIVYPFRAEALAKYNLHICIWFMDCLYSCACMCAYMCMCVISPHIKYQEKSYKFRIKLWVFVETWWQRAGAELWLRHGRPLPWGSPHLCLLSPRVCCHSSIRSCCCFSHYRGTMLWFHISNRNGEGNIMRRLHEFSCTRPAALVCVTYVATGTFDF